MLFTLIISKSMYAFKYRPEWDGEGGLFFVTGDNAASGIAMLIGCIVIAFICFKITSFIDKDEESKGIKNITTHIFYIIGFIAIIVAISLAFALWWITLIAIIVCTIGAAFYERWKEGKDSTKDDYNTKNDYSKLSSLTSFENFHGTLEVGCVVNDNNGDYFDICRCVNYKGSKLYIGFSPYLGKISYDKIARMKDKLYIRCDGNACNFLCTKESEERYKTDSDMESQQRHYLEYGNILSVLKQLNIEGKAEDYTFTNEEDF